MAEFQPVRESLVIATAAILAAGVTWLLFPGDRGTGGVVVLVFLLFVFIAMTLYLGFRLLYSLKKEGK